MRLCDLSFGNTMSNIMYSVSDTDLRQSLRKALFLPQLKSGRNIMLLDFYLCVGG